MENKTPFVTTITTTDPAAFAAELFKHYWVFSVGAETYVGRDYNHTMLLVVNKSCADYNDALATAHGMSDEVRENVIDDVLGYVEDMIDWELYDEDELDEDTRYDIVYDEALSNTDCWAEVIENWDEIGKIAANSDRFELWAIEGCYDPETYEYMNYLMAMVNKVLNTVDDITSAIAALDNAWDGTNCDDNKNTNTSESAS